MTKHRTFTYTLSVSVVALLTACGEAPPADNAAPGLTASGDVPMAEFSALHKVLGHFPMAFSKLSAEPLPSMVARGSVYDLWVSDVGFLEYAQVSATRTRSNVTLPVGTTVLRVVRNAETGRVTKYTALSKREPGYNPPSDLWYAVYDVLGDLVSGADGTPQEGKMPSCDSCHLARSSDAFVFGRTQL